jgi:translation initiation factor IF-3
MQHTKEIRYRFNISDHDLAVKHRKVLEFLSKHYTVKYALELKGREKSLVDRGLQKLQQNLEEFRELALWKDPYVSIGSNGAEISTVLHAK